MSTSTPDLRPVSSSFRQSADTGRLSGGPFGRAPVRASLPILPAAAVGHRESGQPRSAHRVQVTLKALIQWQDSAPPQASTGGTGVLANLSGSGAKLFLRRVPATDTVRCSLTPPDAFVEEQARRQLSRGRRSVPGRFISGDRWDRTCERIAAGFADIEARIIDVKLHKRDAHGPIYALSLAFPEPREGCYRLVRYLENAALQREARDRDRAEIAAA